MDLAKRKHTLNSKPKLIKPKIEKKEKQKKLTVCLEREWLKVKRKFQFAPHFHEI